MAQNNPTDIDTIGLSKAGLVTDLNSSYIGKDSYSYARNSVRNSKEGDLGTIGNEPSNEMCFSAPYKIVGSIPLLDNDVMIFSTNEINSEIGIGNYDTCTYKTIKNDKCLNFSRFNQPITGKAKKDFQKGLVVTFTDRSNPVRRIVVNKIADQSCEDILLFKKIGWPCITAKKNQVGNMPNGMYSIAIAYVMDNEIFSDYLSITNRITLFSENGSNSIDLKISDLDTEFKQYSIIVVGNYIDPTTKKATKLAKNIGTFSTKTTSISISDFLNDDYNNVKISDLVITKDTWKTAGIIQANANYLLLADLVKREEEDYQLKAMSIKAEYVIEQVLADYYETDGSDIGYYADENYDFYIQGVYNTGELTSKFHIPGRQATADDRAIMQSADVYEYDKQFNDCEEPGKVEKWQAHNTAEKLIPYNNKFSCNRRVLGHGKMGYFESTLNYPDNIYLYGQDAGKPQRFHKMPDECKVPRFSKIDGKTYINIKGVRFYDIPAFNSSDIIGYRILRSDRKGGNGTVIARGLMTNIRSYVDKQTKEEVIYSNYGVNDLSPDQFISATQTSWKNGSEHYFEPLTNYYKDRFTFYSPHTLFEPRYSLGQEIKIESQEVASITGQFEKVYKHPKAKLMNQFSFWLSAAVGFIEASLTILGKRTVESSDVLHKESKTFTGPMGGVITSNPLVDRDNILKTEFNINTVGDLINLDIIGYIKAQISNGKFTGFGAVRTLLTSIASLGLKVPYSILQGIQVAEQTFQTISNFTGYTDYVYQYNAHALFDSSVCQRVGDKRRRVLTDPLYIPSDVVTIEDKVYNNYFRERGVYLHLNKEINDPTTKDNSRQTAASYGICDNITSKVQSTGSAFYVTNKTPNPNQYGRVGSSTPVSLHGCPLSGDTTPILYGGDCIITRFQFQKRMQFFNENLSNSNYPDGVEYDYRQYRNIGYPRFWMDTTKYDFSELLNNNVVNYSKFSRTTTGKYNLDCKSGKDGSSITRIDNAHMYTSHNTVLDFFVECDYNINFREKTDKPFYSKKSTNLSQIFRSDRLEFEEEFNINRVYSDLYTTEVSAVGQRDDYDPSNPIPSSQPNSVIYSLPSFNMQEVDNWQYFLPANYFNFRESDFGTLTTIQNLDQDRLMFLFTKASPFVSMGKSLLQLNNQTVTIGDGGLFAQDPRELMPTGDNYASSNSRYAFSNTHMGRFYPSAVQGRIISYTESLDDITRQGISYWCKNYMPIFLYNYFPNYPKVENPISGVGYLTAFDSFNETFYITKRDFSPKFKEITYAGGKFYYKDDLVVDIHDRSFFSDISWTLSYSPMDKSFVSWHDWHPDWIIQTDNHFLTVKDKTVWKHNELFDDFCKFYGQEFPWEIEPISSSGQTVETIRSLEYLLEAYRYKNNGRDRFHILNDNFSHLIVRNTEQISPLLTLVHGNPDPILNLQYPKKTGLVNIGYDVTFFKEENKYRINQFWDTVKDRGEFSKSENHLFPTDESGYKSVINPLAIDINKPEEQRKKFRHYWNKFRLIKDKSGSTKFLFKLLNIKKQISPR